MIKAKSARLDSPQSCQILFLHSKEQRNVSCNHQPPSAIILKYIMLCSLERGFTTWLYCAGSPRARATSSKFYSSSMIYKRKITMWRNFVSVWFFMQHERWAFVYIILFRAYFIFVHRKWRVHNRGSQIPLSRLLFFSIPPFLPYFTPESRSCPIFLRHFLLDYWNRRYITAS